MGVFGKALVAQKARETARLSLGRRGNAKLLRLPELKTPILCQLITCFRSSVSDEAVPARSGYEINIPRLDVGVRRGALGQGEGLIH